MAYTNLCGKKLQAKLGGCLNESATSHSPALLSSQQSFAKRQLEKMGWEEGTGLGKRRHGIHEHLKIKQREDEVGLGREKELAREIGNVWWKDSVGGTLARLQLRQREIKDKKKRDKTKSDIEEDEKKKKKRKKDKRTNYTTKKSSSRRRSASDDNNSSLKDTTTIKTYTDEELFQATGGARFGMRAQRRAEGKWKRTESASNLVELEKKAKTSIEWNGRGNAKVAGANVMTAVEGNKAISSSSEEEEEAVKEISAASSVSHPATNKKRKRAGGANTNEGEECCDHLVVVDGNCEQGTKHKKKKKQKKERKSEKFQKFHRVSPSAALCAQDKKTVTKEHEEIEKKKKEKKRSK